MDYFPIPQFQYTRIIGGLTKRGPQVYVGESRKERLTSSAHFLIFLALLFNIILNSHQRRNLAYLILYCFDNRCTSHLKSHTSEEMLRKKKKEERKKKATTANNQVEILSQLFSH